MFWRRFHVAVLALLLGASWGQAKPNIILLLADDLGWSDVGFQGGHRHATPNLNALAEEGMVFSNFHTSHNCSPTRAALMTGLYSIRTGIYTVGEAGRYNSSNRPLQPVPNQQRLPLEFKTLAQAMKSLGYTTGMFGKWHLGDDGEYHPSKRGFDEAIVTSIDKHFNFSTTPETSHPEGQYLANFLTDRAVDFIERHKDGPFFLYLPHLVVHRPMQADASAVMKIKETNPEKTNNEAIYAAMVKSVDDSVGRIRKTLRDLGIERDTVFVFCSDNGGVGGYQREGMDAEDLTDNYPLRSGKGSLYEGGVRVPMVISWPGNVAAGSQSDITAIHVDLFPTLFCLGGGEPSAVSSLDGQSLLPWILNQEGKPEHLPVYQHFPGYLGIDGKEDQWRTTPVSTIQVGRWKLLEFLEDGRLELYDLLDDPGETKNLSTTYPDKARDLHSRIVQWRERVHAPMPKRKETP